MPQFIMICVMLMVSGVAEATSRKTALSVELMNLGRFIQLHHDQYGEYPQTWDELEKITPGLDSTFSILKPTKRMMLISPPIELTKKYGGGMALAITREPFRPKSWTQWPLIGITREYLKDPSYAIIVSMDGGTFLRHVPPDVTRSIFEAKSLPLPQPSGLGAFPYEREFMTRRIINWSVALAFGSWLVWRFIRKRKKQRSEQDGSGNGG
jgi:hypothetical protein